MDRDELEFLISQYVDGTLAGGKREALEARLKLDPAARTTLAEYRALDAELKSLPLPKVQWDALASRISSAVAEAEEPAQSYRLADFRRTRWMAAAAAVLIAAGTAFVMLRGDGDKPINISINSDPKPAPEVLVITLGPTETDAAPATAPVIVAIGPSDRLQKQPTFNRFAADFSSRPSQSLIASTARPVQDIGMSPF